DLVVQKRKQDIAALHRGNELRFGDDAAGILVDGDSRDFAQAVERAGRDRLRNEDARQIFRLAAHRIHRTTPATPSTAHCAPSGMARVASSTPSTIGMPRSRASEARCEVEPPSSATTPATRGRM